MGAYENPKFFNAPNYMAGTQAFLSTFQKGLQEGLQKGQDMIADRKAYEDGIYEQGEELKKELEQQEYQYGFTTEIESETFPVGLNKDIVRKISEKKNEPKWMTDWRLSAFEAWEKMEEPELSLIHI